MRYPIKIARRWQFLFSLFGFLPSQSYVEVDSQALRLHYGTANEYVLLSEIASVARRPWPFYFGLGAKLGPSGGVSYVGSTNDVVQINFVRSRPMNVWGPFCTAHARCVIVSLEGADQFIERLRAALTRCVQRTAATR